MKGKIIIKSREINYLNNSLSESYSPPASTSNDRDEITSSSSAAPTQAPFFQKSSEKGERSLRGLDLNINMLKSHELGLAAAWGELMKAIAPRNLEFEAQRPMLEQKMEHLLRQGLTEEQALQIIAAETQDTPMEEYQGDKQRISPPKPSPRQMM